MIGLCLQSRQNMPENGLRYLSDILVYPVVRPFFLLEKMHICQKVIKHKKGKSKGIVHFAQIWGLPALSVGIFVYFLGNANPVLEKWLNGMDIGALFSDLSIGHISFIAAMGLGIWCVLRPRLFAKYKQNAPMPLQTVDHETGLIRWLFTPEAVLRMLVISNLLFLLQNIMDIAYISGGLNLPENVTYAEYAQKGAYSLIFTALLAAVFILIAARPDMNISQKPVIRNLIYSWIAQNILLVCFAMTRLYLYVSEYSLTYWRVSAFIWMGLVACGLCLVLWQIKQGKSRLWLLNSNLLFLFAIAYICSFINFGAIIADYNLAHCREVTGKGSDFDSYYLASQVGQDALPALLQYRQQFSSPSDVGLNRSVRIAAAKLIKVERTVAEQDEWRNWTFRYERLKKELAAMSFDPQAWQEE